MSSIEIDDQPGELDFGLDHEREPSRRRSRDSDGVPTMDHLPVEIEYRDWSPATSKVVSGPTGEYNFPGTRFPNTRVARAYWKRRAGRIIEEYSVLGRYIFRVRRDA